MYGYNISDESLGTCLNMSHVHSLLKIDRRVTIRFSLKLMSQRYFGHLWPSYQLYDRCIYGRLRLRW